MALTAPEIQEWLDDVALERASLTAIFPPPKLWAGTTDLRGRNALVECMIEDGIAFGSAAQANIKQIYPALFTLAWKILDLLIERVGQSSGALTAKRPQISAKATYAQQQTGRAEVASVVGDAGIADRMAALYGGTMAVRHALIHQRAAPRAGGGAQAASAEYIESNEIEAFCRLSLAVAELIESGCDVRIASHVRWWLNQLSRIHQNPDLPNAWQPRPLETYLIEAQPIAGGYVADTEKPHARHERSGYPHATLRVRFPVAGSNDIEVRLEDAPRGTAVGVSPVAPYWI